jgi:hypothetical protein
LKPTHDANTENKHTVTDDHFSQGCACKFLYGPGTDEDKKEEIEKALEAKDELQVEVQFYKKNGESFFSFITPGLSHMSRAPGALRYGSNSLH